MSRFEAADESLVRRSGIEDAHGHEVAWPVTRSHEHFCVEFDHRWRCDDKRCLLNDATACPSHRECG